MNADPVLQSTGFDWITILSDAKIKTCPLSHVDIRCRAVNGWLGRYLANILSNVSGVP
ncbi:MAG: hypothetical protein HRU33_16305 [Rhodobacteraceae bacterium]|nr:hypothetical protein [Paracoccaceae bacterium]